MQIKTSANTMNYLFAILMILSIDVYALNTQAVDSLNQKTYVYSVETVSQTPNYHGWPTVTRSKEGELLLTYSGGRERHVCPFGRIEFMRSSDNGQTWSDAQILVDSILDDRDAAICQSNRGTLLITWFTSTAWMSRLEKIQRWQKMRQVIDAQEYRYQNIKNYFKSSNDSIAQWMIRSVDDGKTWSEPYLVPMMSPHGSIVTSKGRLLTAGKRGSFVGLWESVDDGKTWDLVSKILPMQGHDGKHYHELHIVEAADGTLLVHIRNHNKTYHFETLQTESKDGGKSWTEPHSIGVWGHPSHLLCLKNNKLVMTYGYRGSQRKPSDNNRLESRISMDNGSTWSDPVIIADNLHTCDFGYPTTVELDDNKLLTIWYEVQSDSPNAVLRQAIWKIVKQD